MQYYSSKMKMADLVEANYHLLSLMTRLGMGESFGEKTVDEVCRQCSLDTATFLLLCEVYSTEGFEPSLDVLRGCRVEDILRYLHQSHDYYMNSALVTLAGNIEKLIAPCEASVKSVIWKFFSDYKTELDNHFAYEEGEVIPYVQGLIAGRRIPGFSIDRFEENHSNIDEKLSDLKNIFLKSLPAQCDARQRSSLLIFIFNLQKDLQRHTCIEDAIMVPMVRLIENPRLSSVRQHASRKAEEQKEELSQREIEILVSVAKGLLNKEIAEEHNISINTVITHRKNITRKTGIRTVAGLTVYAILNNLIDINTIK